MNIKLHGMELSYTSHFHVETSTVSSHMRVGIYGPIFKDSTEPKQSKRKLLIEFAQVALWKLILF